MKDNKRRVVVTGMSTINPLGLTLEDFWENMMNSVSGSAPITRFDTSRIETKFACEIKGFDPSEYIDRKAARRMDLYSQYAQVSAAMVIKDAGLNPDELSEEELARIGVVYGSGIGGIQTFYDQTTVLNEMGPKRISPFFIPMLIPNIAAGQISMKYRFRGPNHCVVSACATANSNIIDASMFIRNNYADAILCGGAEASICEIGIAGFNANKALSTRNDEPESASRPFDKTRDGFVMGEGAGSLYLEEMEQAKARGAKIYAELIGVGVSADAYHLTAPDPEGKGAKLAMRNAINDAGIKPEDIDYINMHGTATGLGDIAETKAIKQVFGEHAYKLSLSSTKSMTGHLLGAAGAVEAIASILAINNGSVPPTINFEHPDEDCDLDYTFNKPKERTIDIAMSNAFGFGGHNTTLIFRRFEA